MQLDPHFSLAIELRLGEDVAVKYLGPCTCCSGNYLQCTVHYEFLVY